jgi:hypothetical protein
MFSMSSNQDREMLAMALVGYEAELEKINSKIAELRGSTNGRVKRTFAKTADVEPDAPVQVRQRRKFSKETRKKMAAAQTARWSQLKATAAKDSTLKKAGKKKRLKLSAAERAKISGGQAKTRGKDSDVPF